MKVKLIECPRDAMQGLHDFIPTEEKINYLNLLLKVGFDALDCGSFVSPRHIPQMRDTAQVLPKLNWDKSSSKASVIVANKRGIDDAVTFDEVDLLGYPFSVSEIFQKKNTGKSIADSLPIVDYLVEQCAQNNKQPVIYLSMGFGNPYQEEWSPEVICKWSEKLHDMGVQTFSLSDTVGVSDKETIEKVFKAVQGLSGEMEFGVHFHTTPQAWEEKVATAYACGCKRFDGALKGYGGCPMAMDKLTGNMPTENLVNYFQQAEVDLNIDKVALQAAMEYAGDLFGRFG